jgi:triphosphoribosyl-dephospho-CoA synthetase
MKLFNSKKNYLFYFFKKFNQEKLKNIAVKIIKIEFACIPSLGLVNFQNSGSHKDMNIKTFLKSTKTFYHYFDDINILVQKEQKLNFEKLRFLGIKQEKRMFQATNNINTQKGLIFAYGIIYYISLYSLTNHISFNSWSNLIKNFSKPLEKDFYFYKNKTPGEKIFIEYKIKGARGEALNGYKIVFNKAIPFLKKCLKKYPYLKKEEIYLCLLIFYLKEIDDTTLISKIGYNQSQKIKQKAKILINYLLKKNFIFFKKKIIKKNKYFKKKNISPGGCADLCVITLFLFFIYSIEN